MGTAMYTAHRGIKASDCNRKRVRRKFTYSKYCNTHILSLFQGNLIYIITLQASQYPFQVKYYSVSQEK